MNGAARSAAPAALPGRRWIWRVLALLAAAVAGVGCGSLPPLAPRDAEIHVTGT
jgi:hypothetical protein